MGKAARAKGTHLLAGIYSDDTVATQLGGVREPFETRLARLLEDRHVCSVLTDAPWVLSEELISDLGVRRVVTESKTVERRKKWLTASYEVARKQGIVETVTLPWTSSAAAWHRSSSLYGRGNEWYRRLRRD